MFSKQLFQLKECIEGLKTNLRGHAKICLLIICSCKNHEKSIHMPTWMISRGVAKETLAHLSWTSIGLTCFPSGFGNNRQTCSDTGPAKRTEQTAKKGK